MVRSVLVLVGILVVLLLLVTSGSVSGHLCVRNVGCVRGDDGGFRLDTAHDGAARTERARRDDG